MSSTLPASTTTPTTRADAVGSNRWYLSTAPVVRALVHLCVPMAAAMIVGALDNVIDAGFIGSLHDTALLAAVTLASPLTATEGPSLQRKVVAARGFRAWNWPRSDHFPGEVGSVGTGIELLRGRKCWR